MKKLFSLMHKPAKIAFIAGWAVTLIMLAASVSLYIGAGKVFDYYLAIDISEKLLMLTRPVSIAVCLLSLGLEHFSQKQKNTSD